MDRSGNPHVRQALLEVIENQLRDGEPPETRAALARLMGEGRSRAEAVELLAAVVAAEVFAVMKSGRPFDRDRYAAALAALPHLPGEPLEEGETNP
jgi:hypothetical protein